MKKEAFYTMASIGSYIGVGLSFLMIHHFLARGLILFLLWMWMIYCAYQELRFGGERYKHWWSYTFFFLIPLSFLVFYSPVQAIVLFVLMGLFNIIEFLLAS